jgi:hypothetical protein
MVYFEYGGHHSQSHTLSHISKAILVMEQTNVFLDENKYCFPQDSKKSYFKRAMIGLPIVKYIYI